MEIGLQSMTEKTNNIQRAETENTFKKLSIQIGLNGLSFCVLDTITNKIEAFEKVTFKTQSTSYLMLKELKTLLDPIDNVQKRFSEVVVIHKSGLFSLVPKTLFNADELPNFLKFNAKIMATDHIVYDEIAHSDIINVYVPFTNINNYIFDLFGEFEYKHSGTVMVTTLLNQARASEEPVCYIQVAEKEMEMVVVAHKKLLFYNYFDYKTPEDFLYYLLFGLEQMQIDLEKVQLKLFGAVNEDDDIFNLCHKYIRNVSVFVPINTAYPFEQLESQTIDFTTLSSK